jgi:hypothetical protein
LVKCRHRPADEFANRVLHAGLGQCVGDHVSGGDEGKL